MFSNHFMWKFGRANYILQILNPFIILALIAYIIYLKNPPPQMMTVAPVIVLEAGKATRLACDSKDNSYQEYAINTAKELAQIIYSQSDDSSYNAKAALFGEKFENNSEPARIYHNLILKNYQKSKSGETAQFVLDEASIKSGNDKNNSSIYIVILSGTQIVKTTASTTSNKVTLSIVYKFNPYRGQDGKIFTIQKFNPEFSI